MGGVMRRYMLLMLVVVLGLALVALAGEHSFVGVDKCKMCHKGEKKGMVWEKWSEGPHAGAFASLGSEKAKAVYAELGKTGDPQADEECLSCHTAAPDFKEDGVSCEACHGAGGDYWKMSVMRDWEQAVANGLAENPKEGCVRCHNEKSPTFKGFIFDEYYPRINHVYREGK